VHDHPRSLTDEAIRAVAETDGTIGILFGSRYLTGKFRASTEAVLDHLEHVVKAAGPRHVSVGTDYDGWLTAYPSDQRDCRDSVRLTAGLLRRGYSEEEIRGFLRDNALRVLRAVREAADPTPVRGRAPATSSGRPARTASPPPA
jgi:membrane dipeptidase